MKLQLVTLTGTQVDREVYEVQIPTSTGPIGVFPDHEPMVTIAVPGAIVVRFSKSDPDDKLDFYAIGGGVVEITSGLVRVLVDEADYGDDIIEAESQAALERALELRDKAKDQVELEKAHAMIDRHQVRLNVAGLRRRHRRK